MGLTLRLAWRNLWRHPRRTWLTTGAMIFSNVILVFMISMQVGMYQMMIDNGLRALTGHLQVQAPGYKDEHKIRQVVPDVVRLAADVRAGLGLDTVAARASAFALASSADRSYGIQITAWSRTRARGLEPSRAGRGGALPDDNRRGDRHRQRAGPQPAGRGGRRADLLGSGRDGSFAAAVVTVVGIFDSGVPDMNRSLAEVPLGFFQDTFAMDDAGHTVVILAPDLFWVAPSARVEALLPPARTWWSSTGTRCCPGSSRRSRPTSSAPGSCTAS